MKQLKFSINSVISYELINHALQQFGLRWFIDPNCDTLIMYFWKIVFKKKYKKAAPKS